MRSLIVIILVIVIGLAVWLLLPGKDSEVDRERQQPIANSKYSDGFNDSVDRAMHAYYELTDVLVNWDSVDVNNKAIELRLRLSSVPVDEIPDSSLRGTARSFIQYAVQDATAVERKTDLEAKRRSLHSLTENIYNFLRTIQYDRGRLYLQECPMAFNDEEPGIWLSKQPEIVNPYLGKHHPRYGKGMLSCGETKEVLDYTGQK